MKLKNGANVFALLFLLLGLCLRLSYIAEQKNNVFYKNLIIDAEFYDTWGQEIAGGDYRGGKTAFYQDPLYAYFLAGIYKTVGHDIGIVRIIQACIDVMTMALLFLLGKLLFENVIVGYLSMFLYGIYPLSIMYVGLLDKTTFTIFLVTLTVFCFATALKKPRIMKFFIAGLALGLSIIVRGNLIIWTFVGLFFIYFLYRDKQHKEVWKYCASFFVGSIIIVAGVSLRNYLVSNDFVVITANSGLNFYIGNNPQATGAYREPDFIEGLPETELQTSWQTAELRGKRKITKASEVSSFWLHEGIRYIKEDPANYFNLLLKKITLISNAYEPNETYSFYYFRENSKFLQTLFLNYSFILSAAVIGIFICFRRMKKEPSVMMLSMFLITYGASLLIFFVTARYRLPLVALAIPFAAFTLQHVTAEIERKRLKNISLIVISFAALYSISASKFAFIENALKPATLATPYNYMGFLHAGKNDYKKAIYYYHKAVEYFPGGYFDWFSLGQAYFDNGESERAIECYKKAIVLHPNFADAYNNLGVVHVSQSRYKEALFYFKKALELNPNLKIAHTNYLYILQKVKEGEKR